jgi:hypothetical protein
MDEFRRRRRTSLIVLDDQPLLGVVVKENGHDVTHYFVEDEASDEAAAGDAVEEALRAIGSWSDLDWDEMEAALDRIRHDTPPSPPIEL